MKDLTKIQQDVFHHVASEIERNGYSPTYAEVSKSFGWKSASAAEQHIRILIRKNYLGRVPGAARTLKILSK